MASAANIADFVDYSLRSPRNGQVILPGRLFIPPEAITDPMTPRPLMVYLHGGGAVGTNNITQIEQTPDFMVDVAKQRAAYLYVPQTADTWANITAIDSAMTMINRAVAERNADPNRLYAGGYSNGGGGTWNLLSRNPHRFAAALTLSSVIPASGFNAANLLGTAILTLHARDDATVPVARTRAVVDGILAAAGERLPAYSAAGIDQYFLVSNSAFAFHRDVVASAPPESTINHFIARPDLELMYLESPAGGHTGLLGVFYAPDVYDWMFSHSLAVPEPSVPILAGGAFVVVARSRRRF